MSAYVGATAPVSGVSGVMDCGGAGAAGTRPRRATPMVAGSLVSVPQAVISPATERRGDANNEYHADKHG